MSPSGYSLRRDYLVWTLLGALLAFSAVEPSRIRMYPTLVNWPTLGTLAGLLLLTAGIEESGFLHRLAARILTYVHDERRLALCLLFVSALSAALLTNDIALFILVPLTLILQEYAVLPVRRLVIFEALAVNTGSMLTPIGNPQNIFLWQSSGVHFHEFVSGMAPPVMVAAAVFSLFTLMAFKPHPLALHKLQAAVPLQRNLLLVSALLFVPFLILADLHQVGYGLLAVGLVFLTAFRHAFRRLDWPLLLVFLLMFVDLRLLGEMGWVQHALTSLDLRRPGTLYMTAALLSQAVSNVPATILLSQYSSDWRHLAWGADVGGFGLVIGSLANLIALRLGSQRGSVWAFHAWSLPFFLLCLGLTGLWLAASGG